MENQNYSSGLNPACRNAKKGIYTREVYTIQGNASITFYHRVEALKKTAEVAVRKQTVIVILLNGARFCRVNKNGTYDYIYNPEKDFITSPQLKQFFIHKGCVLPEFRIAA